MVMLWEEHWCLRLKDREREERREGKKQLEEESVKVGLRKEDALCRSKSTIGVNQIDAWMR